MEELNIIELLKFYIIKLPIIILVTLLAILIGYFYIEYAQIPMYHGTTTIILVEKNENNTNSSVTQTEITINEKLVSTYSEIIKSRRVLEQVINELELDITASSLSSNIQVNSISSTPIIEITVSNGDNEQAAIIANKTAEIFKKEITKIYNLENVSIIDEAIKEQTPYNINKSKQLVTYALIGIVLSSGIIFIMYYFNTAIKNKKEIEDKLNLPVLGEIPTASKLIKKDKKKKEKLTKKKSLISRIKNNKPKKETSLKTNENKSEKNLAKSVKENIKKKTLPDKSKINQQKTKKETNKAIAKKESSRITNKKKSEVSKKKSTIKKGEDKNERINSK